MLTKHRQSWHRFKKRGDRKARAELIKEFIPLVHYVLGRMSVYLPRVLDQDDLVAAGTIGLILAVDDFDISREIEFTTFAVPRIRGAILDELREHDWVPRTARRRAAELTAALRESSEEEVGPPDYGKAARLLGMRREDLARLMLRVRPVNFVSLEHPADDDEGRMSVSQLICDEGSADPGREAEFWDDCSALLGALETLPEVERTLVEEYYFGERMQKDIAKDLKVSRSRVSQIHNHAIHSLRDRMEAAGAA
jgi:RNA polymerase sigma factor for flagellar operon FliA